MFNLVASRTLSFKHTGGIRTYIYLYKNTDMRANTDILIFCFNFRLNSKVPESVVVGLELY